MRFQRSAELSKRQGEMAKFHSSIVLRFMDSQSELASHCRTASEHHPTSACVVFRVDRSAQGKTGHPPPFLPPLPPLPSLLYTTIRLQLHIFWNDHYLW